MVQRFIADEADDLPQFSEVFSLLPRGFDKADALLKFEWLDRASQLGSLL